MSFNDPSWAQNLYCAPLVKQGPLYRLASEEPSSYHGDPSWKNYSQVDGDAYESIVKSSTVQFGKTWSSSQLEEFKTAPKTTRSGRRLGVSVPPAVRERSSEPAAPPAESRPAPVVGKIWHPAVEEVSSDDSSSSFGTPPPPQPKARPSKAVGPTLKTTPQPEVLIVKPRPNFVKKTSLQRHSNVPPIVTEGPLRKRQRTSSQSTTPRSPVASPAPAPQLLPLPRVESSMSPVPVSPTLFERIQAAISDDMPRERTPVPVAVSSTPLSQAQPESVQPLASTSTAPAEAGNSIPRRATPAPKRRKSAIPKDTPWLDSVLAQATTFWPHLTVKHSFWQALKEGQVSEEVFAKFVQQDYQVWSAVKSQLHALAAESTQDTEQYIDTAINRFGAFQKEYKETFEWPDKPPQSHRVTNVAHKLKSYRSNPTDRLAPALQLCVSLIPRLVGFRLAAQMLNDLPDDSPAKPWVDLLQSEDFQVASGQFTEIVCELGEPGQEEEAKQIVEQLSDLEYKLLKDLAALIEDEEEVT